MYTFEEWKAKVNAKFIQLLGLGCDDLPDMLYKDSYNAGITATEFVREAMETEFDYFLGA